MMTMRTGTQAPATGLAALGRAAAAMRHSLQHHLNALHVMARLTRLGVSRPRALRLARGWESLAHRWLYVA
jgi:hypothetical protein